MDFSYITVTFFPNTCIPQFHLLLCLCSKSSQGSWPAAPNTNALYCPLLLTQGRAEGSQSIDFCRGAKRAGEGRREHG